MDLSLYLPIYLSIYLSIYLIFLSFSAYAIAGRVDIDFETEPIARSDGKVRGDVQKKITFLADMSTKALAPTPPPLLGLNIHGTKSLKSRFIIIFY